MAVGGHAVPNAVMYYIGVLMWLHGISEENESLFTLSIILDHMYGTSDCMDVAHMQSTIIISSTNGTYGTAQL